MHLSHVQPRFLPWNAGVVPLCCTLVLTIFVIRAPCFRRSDGGVETGQPAGGADVMETMQSAVLGPPLFHRPRQSELLHPFVFNLLILFKNSLTISFLFFHCIVYNSTPNPTPPFSSLDRVTLLPPAILTQDTFPPQGLEGVGGGSSLSLLLLIQGVRVWLWVATLNFSPTFSAGSYLFSLPHWLIN
jgi:hypothetical protein